MPKHLAIDANVLSGFVVFNNTKLADAYYVDSNGTPVSFSKRPALSLTPADSTAIATPTRITDLKNGNLFIGVRIGFQNSVSQTVYWKVEESA